MLSTLSNDNKTNNNNNTENDNSNLIKCTTIINKKRSDFSEKSNSSSSNKRACSNSHRTATSKNKLGEFIMGAKIDYFTIANIAQYLSYKENTNNFYVLKVFKNSKNKLDSNSLFARSLLHNEHILLSLLKNEEGIVNQHGLLKDFDDTNYLVLDCYVPHEFDKSHNYVNLKAFIVKEKIIPEKKALDIFLKIMKVVERMHNKNIVHRNIKMGNITYDLNSEEICMFNFCLGRHLINDNELLTGAICSPAYISPDALSGNAYLGKPNDIWSLGVILFALLFGNFPFFDSIPDRLFNKIRLNDYIIPNNAKVTDQTKILINDIFQLDPSKRLNASQIIDATISIMSNHVWGPISSYSDKEEDFFDNKNSIKRNLNVSLYQVVPQRPNLKLISNNNSSSSKINDFNEKDIYQKDNHKF